MTLRIVRIFVLAAILFSIVGLTVLSASAQQLPCIPLDQLRKVLSSTQGEYLVWSGQGIDGQHLLFVYDKGSWTFIKVVGNGQYGCFLAVGKQSGFAQGT